MSGKHNPLLPKEEAPMFDPLPTQFSQVQRESHRGVIGQQEYDRRTYEALHGDGTEQPAPRRARRAALAASAVTVLGLIGAVAYWLAAF
jgi:hypothetical protein